MGKWAQTEYSVLKEIKGYSLLDVHLLTGRKHQIRVHLAGKAHPVVGDAKYGRSNDRYPTLALHARSLSFTHPINGRRLTFATGMPEHFTRLVGPIELPPICERP